MPNLIELANAYVPMLDEVYRLASCTSDLDGAQIKAADVTPVADPAYTPTAGDYVKAVAGAEINFMILHTPALIQLQKHVAPKIISPEQNQHADAWKYGYRNVGIADVYANKLSGVFCHHKVAGV